MTVTVVDAKGRPIADATVRWPAESDGTAPLEPAVPITPWNHAPPEAETDAEGRVRRTGLDPDRAYRLDVTPPGRRGDELATRRDRWSHDTIFATRGRLRLRTRVEDDGDFAFPPLPVGRWTVTAYVRDADRGGLEATADVDAGAKVDLTPMTPAHR